MDKKCLFCDDDFFTEEKLVYENKFWRVVYDEYPVSRGHVLIIPKKHIESVFKLSVEFLLLFQTIKETKKILDDKFHPDGYNIGINDGEYAGQTIPHLHIHLIPRYKYDGGLPCGVRNVFPQSIADYKKYF